MIKRVVPVVCPRSGIGEGGSAALSHALVGRNNTGGSAETSSGSGKSRKVKDRGYTVAKTNGTNNYYG